MSLFKRKVKDRIKELELDIINEYAIRQLNNDPIGTFYFAFRDNDIFCYRNNKEGKDALKSILDKEINHTKKKTNKKDDIKFLGQSKETFYLLACFLTPYDDSFESGFVSTRRNLLLKDAMIHLHTRDKKWAILNCQSSEPVVKFICRRIFHGDYIIL